MNMLQVVLALQSLLANRQLGVGTGVLGPLQPLLVTFMVADLLAPSSIEVHPDMLVIGAGKQTRYVQTMTVTMGTICSADGSIRCTIWACLC